eukprot:10247363-Ditylum_brightwellii.AAC.1
MGNIGGDGCIDWQCVGSVELALSLLDCVEPVVLLRSLECVYSLDGNVANGADDCDEVLLAIGVNFSVFPIDAKCAGKCIDAATTKGS